MPSPEPAAATDRTRRTLSAVVGGVVAVALMVWALRGVHFAELVQHLRHARLGPLLAAVVIATLTYPIRLVRWRLLLRDE